MDDPRRPSSSIPITSVDHWLAGDASAEEAQQVRQWIAEDGRRHGFDKTLDETAALNAAWQRVNARTIASDLNQRPTSQKFVRQREQKSPRVWPWLTPAAIAIVGIGAALVASFHAGVRTSSRSVQLVEYATGSAQRAALSLPNGAHVSLAPWSTLSVTYADDAITSIALRGEASFRVTSSSLAPFVVRANGTSTRVLGTDFSIRNYSTHDVVQVTVHSGKVMTTAARQSVVIAAGTVAHVTDSTATIGRIDDERVITDWTRGRLVFRNAPVPEMLAVVGRWYGYRFTLTDSLLLSRNVSMEFATTDPRDMLIVLKGTLDVDAAFDHTTITLTPRHSTTRRTAPMNVPSRTMPTDGSFLPTLTEIGR